MTNLNNSYKQKKFEKQIEFATKNYFNLEGEQVKKIVAVKFKEKTALVQILDINDEIHNWKFIDNNYDYEKVLFKLEKKIDLHNY